MLASFNLSSVLCITVAAAAMPSCIIRFDLKPQHAKQLLDVTRVQDADSLERRYTVVRTAVFKTRGNANHRLGRAADSAE